MDISIKDLVPLHMLISECVPNHTHCFVGVVSDVPPAPGQNAWVNDHNDEFFYPVTEFIQCLN